MLLVLNLLGLGCTLEVHSGLVISNYEISGMRVQAMNRSHLSPLFSGTTSLCVHPRQRSWQCCQSPVSLTGAFIHGPLESGEIRLPIQICSLRVGQSYTGHNIASHRIESLPQHSE